MEVVDLAGDRGAAERIAALARSWYDADVAAHEAPRHTCGAWTAWVEGDRSGSGVLDARELARALADVERRVCAFAEGAETVGVMICEPLTGRLTRFAYHHEHASEVLSAMYDYVLGVSGRRPRGKVDAPGMVRAALGMGGGRMPLVTRRRDRARPEAEPDG